MKKILLLGYVISCLILVSCAYNNKNKSEYTNADINVKNDGNVKEMDVEESKPEQITDKLDVVDEGADPKKDVLESTEADKDESGEIYDSWICLNDYVSFEVILADSKQFGFVIKKINNIDNIESCSGLITNMNAMVETLRDGEWVAINKIYPIPISDNKMASPSISIGISESGAYMEEKFIQVDGVPNGRYRVLKKVVPVDSEGMYIPEITDTYYISTEFDIPTGEQG